MSYLSWHYRRVWSTLFLLWRNLILFPFYLFSIPLHLRTLFSPWHRQKLQTKRGFSFNDFFNVVGFNIISRIIGACVRLATITTGLFFMVLCLLIGAIPVIVWPFVIFFSLPLYLFGDKSCQEEAENLLSRHKGNVKQLAIALVKTNAGTFAFDRLHIDPKTVIETIKKEKEIFRFDELLTILGTKKQIRMSDLLFAVSYTFSPIKLLLAKHQFSSHELMQTATWYERLYCEGEKPLLLSLSRIKSMPGIGFEWGYGYTVELDRFAKDVRGSRGAFPILIGRERELERMQETLLKTEGNNILLVGEPGVARHQLVQTLAHRIAIGNCLPALLHKRILKLDTAELTAAKPTTLEVKGYVSTMLEEAASAGNVVLCIDDIDTYLSSGPGKIDLTDIFSQFAQSSVAVIGITTPSHYHQYIEPNPTLDKLFEKIEIAPVPLPILMEELEIAIVPPLEKKYSVYITYQALKKTVEDADRYISETPFPGKAIELLDEVCVYATARRGAIKKIQRYVILPDDVDSVISEKTKIDIGALQAGEKDKLLHLEELLHKRVINQEGAIGAIAGSLRRARLEISARNKPIGSFLFLGPTGVGKTETAKALASAYFTDERNLLRFDMSQYQLLEGLERLIGSVKLGTAGELTSKLRDNPFCVLLLDEFEKADKQIYNLFLTLLDEGYITDGLGKKVDAKNCFVIVTSNAGSEFIREQTHLASKGTSLQEQVVEYVQREKIFSPEFLNRFDSVVVFTPLSEGHLREVVKMQLLDLNKRLVPKEISVKITPELIGQLATLGYDPVFGARAIKRKIADTIEDQIAKKLLDGTAKKGEEIVIDLW